MNLMISILYCKYLYFSCTLSQSLQSLTLTKPRMQGNLGRKEYLTFQLISVLVARAGDLEGLTNPSKRLSDPYSRGCHCRLRCRCSTIKDAGVEARLDISSRGERHVVALLLGVAAEKSGKGNLDWPVLCKGGVGGSCAGPFWAGKMAALDCGNGGEAVAWEVL
jgi:hypothetical protein